MMWLNRKVAALSLLTIFLGLFRPVHAQTAQNPNVPQIFVVGDSTARNNTGGAQGWGDPFISYFDPTKVTVFNRAMAGRSSRSYIFEGRWDNVLKEMKAGDFVLLQMGHNDGGNIEDAKARASLPGLGDESREVTRPDGTRELVHSYGWYMRKFIAETKAKGATPILLSLTVRRIWKEGRIERGSGRYGQMVAELAREAGLEFLDLTNIVANQYETMGEEKVKPMFVPDNVHTSPAGAETERGKRGFGLEATEERAIGAFFVGERPRGADFIGGARNGDSGNIHRARNSGSGSGDACDGSSHNRPARTGSRISFASAACSRRSSASEPVSHRRFDGSQWKRRWRRRSVGLGRARLRLISTQRKSTW